MKNLVFVADFFVEQGVTGGAEVCNDELIGLFLNSGYVVERINSHILEPKHIQTNKFYIIANFMNLSKASKKALNSVRYIIFEHDHKYVSTNDPSIPITKTKACLKQSTFVRKTKLNLSF